jgi:hypothetical protein
MRMTSPRPPALHTFRLPSPPSRAICALLLATAVVVALDARRGPALDEADRVRIAEAFHLADALGDRLWPGWSAAPFAVLLVTPDQEFLVRHPKPTPDFTSLGDDAMLGTVWARPRQFDVNLLASFPAVGDIPSVVIGQPANTAAKTSTRWVLTLLHEHFHQMQYSLPGYYPGVNALGLARGDQQGSWMLNYPFPYDKPDVQAQFARMCARLDEAINEKGGDRPAPALRAYLEAKRALRGLVSADDYKYFSFQLWQEGIARYTEYRIGALAASGYVPDPAFARLPDFTTYAAASQAMLDRIHTQLTTVALGEAQRSAFYPVGAAEGLLLDRVSPKWRAEYAKAGFTLDGLLERK